MSSQPDKIPDDIINEHADDVSSKTPAGSSTISTPPHCTADFCLIPLGTPSASVSKEVAEVQRILKKSGLNYSMHSAGTTVYVAFKSRTCIV
jgi:hypothetical protein